MTSSLQGVIIIDLSRYIQLCKPCSLFWLQDTSRICCRSVSSSAVDLLTKIGITMSEVLSHLKNTTVKQYSWKLP